FECKRHVTLELGRSRHIVMGEIVYAHYRDGVVDPQRLHAEAELSGEFLQKIAELPCSRQVKGVEAQEFLLLRDPAEIVLDCHG
ncbi:hypothetical protein ACC739_37485, partial [Rhizobium ruizarguesonis]